MLMEVSVGYAAVICPMMYIYLIFRAGCNRSLWKFSQETSSLCVPISQQVIKYNIYGVGTKGLIIKGFITKGLITKGVITKGLIAKGLSNKRTNVT